MGVDTRRPPLPAPTDSALETAGDSVIGTDFATDLSRQTNRTSHTIPDDGSPITLATGMKRSNSSKLTKTHQHSQTSLLIEYYEGGKGATVTSRPSVRVKVTPSAQRKAKDKDKAESHIVVTEGRGTRKPSRTRRISLGTDSPGQLTNSGSVSSLASLGEDSHRAHRGPGVEVEILQKDGSDLSGTSGSKEATYFVAPSDISSMPPDSMFEGNVPVNVTSLDRSRSISREELADKDMLTAPSRRRSRSLSRERLTQKVMEKLQTGGAPREVSISSGGKPREISVGSSGRRRHGESSRSRSVSKEQLDTDSRNPQRKSGRRHREDESTVTGAESSVLTTSLLSASRKSVDQYSTRSGTSKSSINNPKLLETVEDAIRRLILPELKEIRKDNKITSNRHKFDKDSNNSNLSGSSVSREEVVRRVSKHGSAPEINPKTLSSRDSRDSIEPLSSSRRRERSRKEVELDSASERSYKRRGSRDTLSTDGSRSHRKSSKEHRLRDKAPAALEAEALTTAALQHHDSRSSVDRREQTEREDESRSRSVSVDESEEIFHKHEVPLMPMRSEVDSELTRSSLLSEQTADTTTPKFPKVLEVIRGSPREVLSPAARTPTRTPVDLKKGLGTHHGNYSNRDLTIGGYESDFSTNDDHHQLPEETGMDGGASRMGRFAVSNLVDDERVRAYENNLHHQHPIRRGLSPIQSVASYTTTEPNRNSLAQRTSTDSLSSINNKQHQIREEMSIDSLSSAPSTNLARSKRPEGISLENRSEILAQLEDQPRSDSRNLDADEFYDEQHSENEKYRQSSTSSGPKIDVQHMTNYTDDGIDDPYLDKVAAGQQVAKGHGATPEYIHTPPGVESAVASLCDPSLVSMQDVHSPNRSYTDSNSRRDARSPQSMTRELIGKQRGSPLKQQHIPRVHNETTLPRADMHSPPQSVTMSDDERESLHNGTPVPVLEHPAANASQEADSPQSEITTNPSVIQGPIGGLQRENRDHWPYNPTPPQSKGNQLSPKGDRHGLSATDTSLTTGAVGTGLGVGATRHGPEMERPLEYNKSFKPLLVDELNRTRDAYIGGQNLPPSPGVKDEGYMTGDNPREPGLYTPDQKRNGVASYNKRTTGLDDDLNLDEPLSVKHSRHLSGLSQGMGSPLYDSATGRGIDRIQSKDIIALMDHLTVRDAQRNARDTEILVTLVRSAAEMRNSFEDMKRYIAEQDDLIMDTADRQHEKTQKVVSGPRPQPVFNPRGPRRTSEEEEDSPAKRTNVFKRALRGLSSKNTNELQNIEGMLMQLLGDVEGLRAEQQDRRSGSGNDIRPTSLNSADNLRAPTDPGYEPEGQAGTSSTGDRSGFFSNNSSRQADHRASGRRESANRVSTVMEGDEDLEPLQPHEQSVLDHQVTNETHLLTPTHHNGDARDIDRGGSVPIATPPRLQHANPDIQSNENSPSDGKSKSKHKSTSSSFFPKISRWSKTTASSFGDNLRVIGQNNKSQPYSPASQSDSNVEDYPHDPQGDDRLRSNTSFANGQHRGMEHRPPSPLVPSQVSEDPKYQAHRNSLNLQHPQPRPGPTGRFQHHLETEAQYYGGDQLSPSSQNSSQWDNQPAFAVAGHAHTNSSTSHNYSGNREKLSPISDTDSSSAMDYGHPRHESGSRSGGSTSEFNYSAPARPPKVKDNDPLVPQRPPKITMSPGGPRQPTYVDHVNAARAGSPAYDKSPVAALRSSPAHGRKPSGPRPITSPGQVIISHKGDKNNAKKTRFRGSPNQIDSEEDLMY